MECWKGEAARRWRGNDRGKIGHGQWEEALDSGIELAHAGTAEVWIGRDAEERYG